MSEQGDKITTVNGKEIAVLKLGALELICPVVLRVGERWEIPFLKNGKPVNLVMTLENPS